MKFDDIIKREIELILQTKSPFNDSFVKNIRDLKTYYGYKINLVVRGIWAYPCSACQLHPRKLVSKGDSQVFEKTADEHCCYCLEAMDIKYMSIPQLETYVNYRTIKFKEKDLGKHPENLPLYEILTPELVFPTIKERQMEKALAGI